MAKFDMSQYEEVKDRLPRFFERHPNGRVITDLMSDPQTIEVVVFCARLYADGEEQGNDLPLATGWAFEQAGEGMVNKTSHLENCETSAIGRALANIGLHGAKRPSREEMQKTQPKDSGLQAKRKGYFAKMRELGADGDEAKEWVKGRFELESFNDATYEQLGQAYKDYKDYVEGMAQLEEEKNDTT